MISEDLKNIIYVRPIFCSLSSVNLVWLKIIILSICLVICYSTLIFSQTFLEKTLIKFERITIEQGLSQSTVNCILQDRKGYLWFGTDDGLNKYDGYTFKIYKNDPLDSTSISNNNILTAFEDQSGLLWFGTGNGLNKYDPENEQFATYWLDSKETNSPGSNYINSIYESAKKPGVLWIGTNGGLKKLSSNNSANRTRLSIVNYTQISNVLNSLSNYEFRTIVEDSSEHLWIATSDGLIRFDPENLNFNRHKHDPLNSNSLSNSDISIIRIDKSGNLWIGTNDGLNKLLSENFKDISPLFIHYKNDPQNPASLSNNHISSIFESRVGILWVGTLNGLNKMVPNNLSESGGSFIQYKSDKNNSNSIIDDWIRSIYEDRSGILWVGCLGGLNKYSPKKNKFSHYRLQDITSQNLSSDFIFAFYEDSYGMLWIGTFDEGLLGYNKKSGKITHYKNIPGKSYSLSSNRVRSILEDKKGRLWIGTLTGGLNRFERKKNSFIHYRHNVSDPYSISANDVIVIFEDHYGDIWIGTNSGLNKFDSKNNRFIQYLNDPYNQHSLSNNLVWAICEDKLGNLWIGTDNGLDKFDRKTGNFSHYIMDSNGLTNNRIYSIHTDQLSNLWIGTGGGGLNKFDYLKETFTSYRIKEGLPNEVIYGILEDKQNNLWLSTNYGISRLNQNLETFYNYDITDGLQSNEFNLGAFYKSKSGEMFFGGVNGFNAFYPENIKQSQFIPPIVITSFLKFNKEVLLDKPISNAEQIELSYKDYLFSFEFASLDYQAPEKNRFAYKMEGLDEEWIYSTSDKRFATYTTLPPGEYIFKVKGSNSDGVWNEKGTTIKIIITPPYWQTWWFRTIAIAFIFALILVFYKQRVRKLEEKKIALEDQVKERTEAAQKIQDALTEVELLKNQLQVENIYLQDEIKLTHNFENIISTSESFKKILYKVEQVSSTDATVLILGESGTGKELLARAIHNLSNRKNKPLIKVNCATLPSNLIESELFGYEKGAFTGAFTRKVGRFELADHGTIFLDEIGELPLELQTKLLRVLQESEFERLGGTTSIMVDVRVIAATNRDLEDALEKGLFREDLYYRLNIFPIKIPPLRERKEDIPILVNHFINKHSKKLGKRIETISPQDMNKLIEYNWTGNVRELENIIERAIIVSSTKNLNLKDSFSRAKVNGSNKGFQSLQDMERNYILEVLESTNWRVSGPKGAAKILGLVPSTLEFRMKKLNINRK